jgi:DNA modification methylase
MKKAEMKINLHLENCLDAMRGMADQSVDSIVTDPPYGLSFMGKKWDYDVPSVEIWAECLRVLKPGGHLLAFAGTRTQHRMAVRIEDAGFEIRDMIAWVYGSGFPKSLDVSKAIDKAAGAEVEKGQAFNVVGGTSASNGGSKFRSDHPDYKPFAPATEAAQQWEGWGTALKPALEPITVARKPLMGTVAENVLEHGTGGLNIDGCRVVTNDNLGRVNNPTATWGTYGSGPNKAAFGEVSGRWPANLIHDGSDEVMDLFPETVPSKASARGGSNPNPMDWGNGRADGRIVKGHNDNGGSAARFFYCAKASRKDRDEGLEGFEKKGSRPLGISNWDGQTNGSGEAMGPSQPRANIHPTVKPTDLMRYLCRLVTPPGGVVLDPFMGSGSTGKAVILEGFDFVGCEMSPEYFEIARARIEHAAKR